MIFTDFVGISPSENGILHTGSADHVTLLFTSGKSVQKSQHWLEILENTKKINFSYRPPLKH